MPHTNSSRGMSKEYGKSETCSSFRRMYEAQERAPLTGSSPAFGVNGRCSGATCTLRDSQVPVPIARGSLINRTGFMGANYWIDASSCNPSSQDSVSRFRGMKTGSESHQKDGQCDIRRKRSKMHCTVVIGRSGQRPITPRPQGLPQGQEDLQQARSYDQKADYGLLCGNDYARKASVGDLETRARTCS